MRIPKAMKHVMHLVVPHPANGHRPHILRTEIMLGLLVVTLVFEAAFLWNAFVLVRGGSLASIMSAVVIDETNARRQAEEIAALVPNQALSEAAARKARDMAEKSYFAHTSPEGISPWHWFKEAGYEYTYAGENLAVNFVDSEDVVEAWMRSPSHKANVLSGRFTEIGIGMATGTYKGRETIFVVQLFGAPQKAEAAEPAVAAEGERKDDITAVPAAEVAAPPASPAPLPAPVAAAEMFDEHSEAAEPVAVLGSSEVLKDQIKAQSSAARRIMSKSRRSLNSVYLTLATLVALAVVLKVFVKYHPKHARLIANGIVFVMLIAAVSAVNYSVAVAGIVIR